MNYHINKLELLYLTTWMLLCLICIILVVRNRRHYEFLSKDYIRFLTEPWKLTTFVLAMTLIVLAAPYSGDHTWDTRDSIFCSILTFYFCPWALSIFYRHFKNPYPYAKLLVAFCLFWLPCWAYDAYILVRDKTYPSTWWPNLIISGGICFSAGLFWNLAWTKDDGAYFAFYKQSWPNVPTTPFVKIFSYTLVLTIPVASSVGWLVWHYFYPNNY